ncbi:MAG: hypothetical protein WBY96_11500 [Candidatus Sulfotelmatobacter sp.]
MNFNALVPSLLDSIARESSTLARSSAAACFSLVIASVEDVLMEQH